MSALNDSPVLKALRSEARNELNLPGLFDTDAERANRFTFDLDKDFSLDVSKQQITPAILTFLIALARQQEVERQRDAMLRGKAVNTTEKRAVLHTALRQTEGSSILVDGKNVMPQITAVRKRMEDFAESVRAGHWKGPTGQPIRTVVHLGIGGSHLGPELATKALRAATLAPAVRFVANVDPAALASALNGLDPATTLFIVASKAFTTSETMANAKAARTWLIAALGEAAVSRHFVACSSNTQAVKEFGIDPANMFEFWDWVGGRFSLWSSIGLPVLIAIGTKAFGELLEGAHDMDEHFGTAPLEKNIPVIHAMLGVWNRNIQGRHARAVLPYAEDLSMLSRYLQQLEMESNGKGVEKDGTVAALQTASIVFGQTGTNVQHAFFQLLHQGTEIIPAEFLVFAKAHPDDEKLAPGQQRILALNALAQSAALMKGQKSDDPARNFPGNRPSTTILMNQLTPRSLGRLLAMYEHSVAVEGWIWNINSFDQFGVELGKKLVKELQDSGARTFDSSTQNLISRL